MGCGTPGRPGVNASDLRLLLDKALTDEVERTGVSMDVCHEAGVHLVTKLRKGFRPGMLLAPLLAAALRELDLMEGRQ